MYTKRLFEIQKQLEQRGEDNEKDKRNNIIRKREI